MATTDRSDEASKRGGPPGCLLALAVSVVLVLMLVAYGNLKVRRAQSAVTRLCEGYTVGAPFDPADFAKRADALGLRTLPAHAEQAADQGATALAWQGFAFARWFCEVKHTDTVLERRVRRVD
jgi:predicted amino acid dehydrogenase